MFTVYLFIALILQHSFDPETEVKADSFNPQVLDTNSTHYGFGYPEWSAKWWKWALEIPQDKSPIADSDGRNCAINQNISSRVWFLAGTGGGSVTRECEIPHGMALFFPILNTACSYAEDSTLNTP